MAAEVIVQVLLARERLQADAARERLVGGVALHVPLQAGLVGEHMIADGAREHAAAAVVGMVRLAVRGQLLRAGERLAAHLADERLALVVVAPVHDQLVFVREHFAAHLARVRRRHQRQPGQIGARIGAGRHRRAGGHRRIRAGLQMVNDVADRLQFRCDH